MPDAPGEVTPAAGDKGDVLENARAGYAAAVQTWASEGSLVWSKFSGMTTAHTILLATIGIALTATRPHPGLSIWFAVIGLLLCAAWVAITIRSFDFLDYCILTARELERRHLAPVDFVRRGKSFMQGDELDIDGEKIRHRLSRGPRVQTTVYFVVGLFAFAYVVLIYVAAITGTLASTG